jgi:hypothetical protein
MYETISGVTVSKAWLTDLLACCRLRGDFAYRTTMIPYLVADERAPSLLTLCGGEKESCAIMAHES